MGWGTGAGCVVKWGLLRLAHVFESSTEKISEWSGTAALCCLAQCHLYVQEYKCKCHANKTLKSVVRSIRWTYDQAPQVGQCDKTFESQDSVLVGSWLKRCNKYVLQSFFFIVQSCTWSKSPLVSRNLWPWVEALQPESEQDILFFYLLPVMLHSAIRNRFHCSSVRRLLEARTVSFTFLYISGHRFVGLMEWPWNGNIRIQHDNIDIPVLERLQRLLQLWNKFYFLPRGSRRTLCTLSVFKNGDAGLVWLYGQSQKRKKRIFIPLAN